MRCDCLIGCLFFVNSRLYKEILCILCIFCRFCSKIISHSRRFVVKVYNKAAILKLFKRLRPLTNSCETLRPITSVQNVVKINVTVQSLPRSNTHTNENVFVIPK